MANTIDPNKPLSEYDKRRIALEGQIKTYDTQRSKISTLPSSETTDQATISQCAALGRLMTAKYDLSTTSKQKALDSLSAYSDAIQNHNSTLSVIKTIKNSIDSLDAVIEKFRKELGSSNQQTRITAQDNINSINERLVEIRQKLLEAQAKENAANNDENLASSTNSAAFNQFESDCTSTQISIDNYIECLNTTVVANTQVDVIVPPTSTADQGSGNGNIPVAENTATATGVRSDILVSVATGGQICAELSANTERLPETYVIRYICNNYSGYQSRTLVAGSQAQNTQSTTFTKVTMRVTIPSHSVIVSIPSAPNSYTQDVTVGAIGFNWIVEDLAPTDSRTLSVAVRPDRAIVNRVMANGDDEPGTCSIKVTETNPAGDNGEKGDSPIPTVLPLERCIKKKK